MSTFILNDGQSSGIATKITGSAPVVIIDGTKGQASVAWMRVNENSGATPNLTVELYNVATGVSIYQGDSVVNATWVAKAVTAKQSVAFTEGIIVPLGQQLRVSSSDPAGKFDVTGIKISGRAGS